MTVAGAKMRVAQWARLHTPARCGLRWGAWYPVMALTPREAQLWVRGRAVVVARSLLELRSTPPREWTVARTAGAAGVADEYLVCPSCRYRAHLPDGRVATMRCPRCNELFAIAWDHDSSEPSREELRADRRMSRRRNPRERRNDHERRAVERRSLLAVAPAERRRSERRLTLSRRLGSDRRDTLDRRRRATSW